MLNFVMFLGQASLGELKNSVGIGNTIYSCQNNLFSQFDSQNCNSGNYSLKSSDATSSLPNYNSGVDVNSGNLFTDTFNAVKNWLLNATGLRYLFDFVASPVTLLQYLGLPSVFIFGISALWYGITLFLLVSWIAWREG